MMKLDLNLALLLLLGLLSAGCQSMSGPGSASFASVVIEGHSPEEIAAAATQVFHEDGYNGGGSGLGPMVFEKEGSRMNSLAYEGVANTYYGAQTIVRVKAEIVPLGPDKNRLQCQAYVVSGTHDPFFTEEKRLTNIRSRPYQNLLDKVADRFKK
jgi:hypothetical protein